MFSFVANKMMATAVLQKPQTAEKTGTWAAIFPTEQVTETQSALFVKKLLAVAVSNITYLRAIFPEHAFGDRSLEGLNLKILRDDVSCPGASQVIKWMKGCFDAFDKKYLRLLMIGLHVDPEDPDTMIEAYTFKFSYIDGGGIDIYRNNEKISGAKSEAETRKATIRLLRSIILLTQTLDSLPDDVMMTMKLLYYDDVTPVDYEPPGFKAADNDNFLFEDEPMTIKVGDVNTNYHSIQVRVKTDRKQFELKDKQTQEEGVVEDTSDKEINTGLDDDIHMESVVDRKSQCSEGKTPTSVKSFTSRLKEPLLEADVPTESPAKPGEEAVDVLGSEVSQTTDTGDGDYKVRCPCGCNEDDGLMIMCAECKFWQHGVCFLVVDEEDAPDHHICDTCAVVGERDKEPTDFYLTDLAPIQIQATCLWRRTLVACLDMTRILAPVLAKRLGTEMTVAQGLMHRLDKEGYLKAAGKGKRLGKLVDKDKITKIGIPKYMVKQERPQTLPVHQQSQDDQSQIEPEVTDSPKEMQTEKNEIDFLAEKTESLKINKKKERLSRKKNKQQEKMSEAREVTVSVEDGETQRQQQEKDMKRLSRKRAVSRRDQDQEFEISSTQDVYDDEPRIKKKASVVSKKIMV